MIIKIDLKENREITCNNSVIGKTFENNATILEFNLTEDMSNKDFYLEFEKPDGNKFISSKLEISSSLNEETKETEYYVIYEIPNTLLDIKGQLKLEVVLRNNNKVWKSYTLKFTILNSINATNELSEQYPDFISEANKVIELIEINGEGNKFLSNDGIYKEVTEISGTTNYEELKNKPLINNVELSNNKTLDELGIQAKGDYALNSDIPTKTSQLVNDSGFLTEITQYVETDPTVPTHVKAITEAQITKWDNGTGDVDLTDYAKKSELPTKVSQLTNDENYINQLKTINGQTLEGEGNITIEDLSTEFQEISNEMILVELSDDTYLSILGDWNRTNIPFDTLVAQMGTNLSLTSSGRIKIGAGINKISINASLLQDTSLDTIEFSIRLTRSNSTKVINSSYTGKTTGICSTVTNIFPVLDVQEGDEIDCSITSDNTETITIQKEGTFLSIQKLNDNFTLNNEPVNNYENVENKPQINGVELVGNKSLNSLGIPTYTAGTGISIVNNIIEATGEATVQVNDTGWIQAELDSGVELYYTNDYQPQYRLRDKMVEIRGIVKPINAIAAGKNLTIFYIPEEYRPSYEVSKMCTGSGKNTWLLYVSRNGRVSINRYGITDNVICPAGAYLAFQITYMID